jgi:hypothetical protein
MKTIAQFVREERCIPLTAIEGSCDSFCRFFGVFFAVMANFGLQNIWYPLLFLLVGFFSGLAAFGIKTSPLLRTTQRQLEPR